MHTGTSQGPFLHNTPAQMSGEGTGTGRGWPERDGRPLYFDTKRSSWAVLGGGAGSEGPSVWLQLPVSPALTPARLSGGRGLPLQPGGDWARLKGLRGCRRDKTDGGRVLCEGAPNSIL